MNLYVSIHELIHIIIMYVLYLF